MAAGSEGEGPLGLGGLGRILNFFKKKCWPKVGGLFPAGYGTGGIFEQLFLVNELLALIQSMNIIKTLLPAPSSLDMAAVTERLIVRFSAAAQCHAVPDFIDMTI